MAVQFDTLRLHLVKLAATIVEKKPDRHDTARLMSASKSHPAVRRTGSAIAYITLNNRPVHPETPTDKAQNQKKRPDAKSGCETTTRCRN
jgi:hypothetical protein